MGSLVLVVICLLACTQPQEHQGDREVKKPRELRYTTIAIKDFKYLKVQCDIGRLKLHLRSYDKSTVEIHKTYQKYVRLQEQGDTLVIQTINTPRNASDLGIQKNINLYIPSLEGVETNASRLVLEQFVLPKLKVINSGTSFRLYDSAIKDLEIINMGSSNVLLDPNCVVGKLYIRNNRRSIVDCQSYIDEMVTVESESLDRVRFKNVENHKFKWIK